MIGDQMRTQRITFYLFMALSILTIVAYLSPCPPPFSISANQMNDILISIFGGSFVGLIVSFLEYRRRRYDLDQRYFPLVVKYLHLVSALESLEGTPKDKELYIGYFEERESNELRQKGCVFDFLPKQTEYVDKLCSRFHFDEDKLQRFEAILPKKLHDISGYYLKFKSFEIKEFDAIYREYGFLLSGLSLQQRRIDSIYLIASSYYHSICSNELFGQFSLCHAKCDDFSISETLKAEKTISCKWYMPNMGAKSNRAAYEVFGFALAAIRQSSWIERKVFPDKPFW